MFFRSSTLFIEFWKYVDKHKILKTTDSNLQLKPIIVHFGLSRRNDTRCKSYHVALNICPIEYNWLVLKNLHFKSCRYLTYISQQPPDSYVFYCICWHRCLVWAVAFVDRTFIFWYTCVIFAFLVAKHTGFYFYLWLLFQILVWSVHTLNVKKCE